MPKPPLLTERQQRFASLLSVAPNMRAAAKAAGYSDFGAVAAALDNNPHLREAIRKRISASLTRAAPHALAVLLRIARDERAPYVARVTAARDILDRGGFLRDGTLARAEEVEGRASLADMTAKELQEMIGRLETERQQRRAVVIEAETDTPDDVFG